MKTLQKLGLAVVLATTMGTAMARVHGGNHGYVFKAKMSTAQDTGNTPQNAIDSNAAGSIKLVFAKDLSSATYVINTTNINVVNAHLHCAPAGLNSAPPRLTGVPVPIGATKVNVGPVTITNADINPVINAENCSTNIVNIASLLSAVLKGEIYVNIHTGDIAALRGQIFPKK